MIFIELCWNKSEVVCLEVRAEARQMRCCVFEGVGSNPLDQCFLLRLQVGLLGHKPLAVESSESFQRPLEELLFFAELHKLLYLVLLLLEC